MTAINQDFSMYQGDDAAPIFTIYDGAGAVIDLSTVSAIDWLLHDDAAQVKLTKTKAAGDITFAAPPGDGTDGRIQVAIHHAESTLLEGWYFHSARITDSVGNLSVIEVGRLLVLVRERGE